jgi:hypothetical protein
VVDAPLAVFRWQLSQRLTGIDSDWHVVTPGWSSTRRAVVHLSSLQPSLSYRIDALCVDAAGLTSDTAAAVWSIPACPPAASFVAVVDVVGSGVDVGERAFTWRGVDDATPPHGFEYSVDDSGVWTAMDGASAVVAVAAGVWHSFAVRSRVVQPCAHVVTPNATRVTWFELEPGPGVPSIVSAPTLSSSTVFGDFAFNCSGDDGWLEYALDNSTWAPSDTSLRVGPLTSGAHTLSVRCADAGRTSWSAAVQHTWAVSTASNSTLSLSGVTDGRHALTVWAVDPLGHEEREPRVYAWEVDTVPPLSRVALATSPLTMMPRVVVNATCGGELDASLCVFCWRYVGATPSVASTLDGCSANTSLSLSSRPCVPADVRACSDGDVSVAVTVVDGAGNVNATAVVVSWRVDTVAPNTTLALDGGRTAFVWLPSAAAFVTNATSLALSLSASEAVSRFDVSMDGRRVSLVAGAVAGVAEGRHNISAAAVDVAGNVDTAPPQLSVLVDTTPPTASSVVVTSPAVGSLNSSVVSLQLRCQGETPTMVSRFRLSAVPPLPLPPVVDAASGGAVTPVSAVVNGSLAAVPSGRYTVRVTCVDAAGNAQSSPSLAIITVDTQPPTCALTPLPSLVRNATVSLLLAATDAPCHTRMV